MFLKLMNVVSIVVHKQIMYIFTANLIHKQVNPAQTAGDIWIPIVINRLESRKIMW